MGQYKAINSEKCNFHSDSLDKYIWPIYCALSTLFST